MLKKAKWTVPWYLQNIQKEIRFFSAALVVDFDYNGKDYNYYGSTAYSFAKIIRN